LIEDNSMAEFPALPTFTDAIIADTAHLNNEEFGAYYRLLMFAWRTKDCSLPDDDRRFSTMLGVTLTRWRKTLRPVVSEFWQVSDGKWKQKRLTKERAFVTEKSKKAKKSADTRWRDKSLENNETENADASAKHNDQQGSSICSGDAPTPTPIKTLKQQPDSYESGRERLEPEGKEALAEIAEPLPPIPGCLDRRHKKPTSVKPEADDVTLYRRGREVLGKKAGGVVTKMKNAVGVEEALGIVELAATKADPAEYVGGVLRAKEKANGGHVYTPQGELPPDLDAKRRELKGLD
jgi:uncharacterized protein YdaU (DUF1376 family)